MAQNASPKVHEWQSYGKFRKVTLNRHFSEKVERGDQEKFFKNRPISSPCLKGPKALWRKLNYTLIEMHLKCKDGKIFWRKQRLQKCRNGQVMAIIARSPKTCIFRKSAKRPKEVFQKSPKKYPRFKRPTPLWRKCHYPVNCIHLYCKDGRRVWREKQLQNFPNDQVMAIYGTSPKTSIF